MNFFSKVKQIGSNLAEKSKSMIQSISKDIESVVSEQNKLIQENESEDIKQERAQLPWEGLKATKSNQNGNMIDAIKEEILELSHEHFLIDEENYMYTFEFNLEDYKYVALKVLEEDRTLEFMRSKLVPKKIKDEVFWKNYFYNIEIIKMKYGMANRINPQEKSTTSVSANEQKSEGRENNQKEINLKNQETTDNSNNSNSSSEGTQPQRSVNVAEEQFQNEQEPEFHNDEDDFNSNFKPKGKFHKDDEDEDLDIDGIDLGDKQIYQKNNTPMQELATIQK